jgi:hypothetical protein
MAEEGRHMDLKKFSGKNVCIQMKNAEAWLVTMAKAGEIAEVLMLEPGKRGPSDPGLPCAFPFVQGWVNEDGDVVMDTGRGGQVAVTFNPDVIHSVSIAIKSPEAASRLVAAS